MKSLNHENVVSLGIADLLSSALTISILGEAKYLANGVRAGKCNLRIARDISDFFVNSFYDFILIAAICDRYMIHRKFYYSIFYDGIL